MTIIAFDHPLPNGRYTLLTEIVVVEVNSTNLLPWIGAAHTREEAEELALRLSIGRVHPVAHFTQWLFNRSSFDWKKWDWVKGSVWARIF